jgi:hypothetical protein
MVEHLSLQPKALSLNSSTLPTKACLLLFIKNPLQPYLSLCSEATPRKWGLVTRGTNLVIKRPHPGL